MKSTIKLPGGGRIVIDATHDGKAVRIEQFDGGDVIPRTVRIPLEVVGVAIVGIECAGTEVEEGVVGLSPDELMIADRMAMAGEVPA